LVEKLRHLIDDEHVEMQDVREIWRQVAASFWHSVAAEKAEDWEAITEAVERVYT
jgi:hypothetical protein